MVNSYLLINPHIEGSLKNKVKAQNSQEAGNILYKNLSEHFNNSVPVFHFTIQKGSSGTGKYYHFEVKENRDDDEVNFSINQMSLKGEDKAIERLKTKLEQFKTKFNQAGGLKYKDKKSSKSKKSRHHDDDSSDSLDDSDDVYRRARSYRPSNLPIYYWWYDPFVYQQSSLYIPTFYPTVTPYIELSLKL